MQGAVGLRFWHAALIPTFVFSFSAAFAARKQECRVAMLREANVQLYDSLAAEYFDADVSDHDEIEYKFSLSKASYERLLNLGSVRTERVLKMRNHYFDTRDFRLYSKKARLRFRITNRTDGEVTLKLPSSKVVSSQHPRRFAGKSRPSPHPRNSTP